jgi:hypothetical protein
MSILYLKIPKLRPDQRNQNHAHLKPPEPEVPTFTYA